MDTEDPYTTIERRLDSPIISYKYYKTKSGQEWMLFGKCNCCGQCQSEGQNPNVVWTGIPIGCPNAEFDITFPFRKDIPCRPEINKKWTKCSLWGYYV